MFNMSIIGKKINEYRKRKNLTQMELADYLYVSHQAISNWERGLTMPDIQKLPELASLLEFSIDDLLTSQTNTLLHQVIEEEKIEKVDVDEFIDVAPLLKPHEAHELSEKIEFQKVSIQKLGKILPFINKKDLDFMIQDILVDDVDSMQTLLNCVPYLEENHIEILLLKMIHHNFQFPLFTQFAPYLQEKTIHTIIEKSLSTMRINSNVLIDLLPYISKETLKLILHSMKQLDFSMIIKLAPFCEQEELYNLIEQISQKSCFKESYLIALAPFFDSKYLLRILSKFNHLQDNTLKALFPFINADDFIKVLQNQ